jgi:tetratricopeptide (TPR) repeat protein
MDLSLQEIFERARAAQEWVPPMEADLLFAAALKKAVELGVPLSPAKVMLREGGFLELVMKDTGAEPEQYRAPEAGLDDPRRLDPRALVYSAGAVGYELFTGLPPPRPPHGPGPELTGPLGDVVRVAMAQDRRERFSDLQQLFDAVTVIEPHRSPPEERGLLAALLARVKRWEERAQNAAALAMVKHQYERLEARLSAQELALARFSALSQVDDRLALLESSLKAVRAEASTGTARLQQNVRELVEDRRRDEVREREREETREARLLLHPPRRPFLPIVALAVAAAIVASIATALLVAKTREPEATVAAPVPAAEPGAAPDSAVPVPSRPTPERALALPTEPPAVAEKAKSATATPSPIAPGAVVTGGQSAKPIFAPVAPALAAANPPAKIVDSPATSANLTPKKKARALLDRGDVALEKGHPEAAISAFNNALNADATLAEAHRGLGMAYALQGNDVEAKKEYQLYLSNTPGAKDSADIKAVINELNQRSKLGP